jgi:hypothetical protein
MKKSGGLADSPFFKNIDENNIVYPPSTDELNKQTDQVILGQINDNQAQNRTFVRTDVRTNERTDVRTEINNPPKKRRKIRHAFDIYEDQLQSLIMLQLEAVQKGKKKPKLGKMAQEAIDIYLKRKHSKPKLG